jgi:hypothetical protein
MMNILEINLAILIKKKCCKQKKMRHLKKKSEFKISNRLRYFFLFEVIVNILVSFWCLWIFFDFVT